MGSADDSGHAEVPRQRDPEPGTVFRAVAHVRSTHRGRVYTGGLRDKERGVAPVPRNREQTRRIDPPQPPAKPVFVDDSGRRGRLLGWAALAAALIGLLLVVVFWVGQATSADVGAAPACVTGFRVACAGPAGP